MFQLNLFTLIFQNKFLSVATYITWLNARPWDHWDQRWNRHSHTDRLTLSLSCKQPPFLGSSWAAKRISGHVSTRRMRPELRGLARGNAGHRWQRARDDQERRACESPAMASRSGLGCAAARRGHENHLYWVKLLALNCHYRTSRNNWFCLSGFKMKTANDEYRYFSYRVYLFSLTFNNMMLKY